jgi:hypothetical protein
MRQRAQNIGNAYLTLLAPSPAAEQAKRSFISDYHGYGCAQSNDLQAEVTENDQHERADSKHS